MTALTKIESMTALTAGVDRSNLIAALRDSLYPGAKDESIEMVLSYCQAGGYDPMTKPVHIVPMWDKTAKTMRDTVMPGIGLYRIIADRSGKYAGQDDADFGPDMEGWGIRFPQWCKVTVWKITAAGRVAYSAKVFWIEAYSPASKDTDAPNAMWKKRPYGQLEKCAEAAALRKAFPEIGSQPTADEMQGRVLDIDPPEPGPVKAEPSTTRADALKQRMRSKDAPVNIDLATGEVLSDDRPEVGEVQEPADPIADLLLQINEAQTRADLEAHRPAIAALKNGLKRRAVSAWKAAEERIAAATAPHTHESTDV